MGGWFRCRAEYIQERLEYSSLFHYNFIFGLSNDTEMSDEEE